MLGPRKAVRGSVHEGARARAGHHDRAVWRCGTCGERFGSLSARRAHYGARRIARERAAARLDVACGAAWCHAAPGEVCLDRQGRRVRGIHPERCAATEARDVGVVFRSLDGPPPWV